MANGSGGDFTVFDAGLFDLFKQVFLVPVLPEPVKIFSVNL